MVPAPNLSFVLLFFDGNCRYHATFLHHWCPSVLLPSRSRKILSRIFFIAVLKLRVFLRLVNLYSWLPKVVELLIKMLTKILILVETRAKSPCLPKISKDFSSKVCFWLCDPDSCLSAVWKSFKVIEWCICSVFECCLRRERYFSFFSFFSSVLQERRGSHIMVGYSFQI